MPLTDIQIRRAKPQESLTSLATASAWFYSLTLMGREWHTNKADRWTVAYRDEIIKTFEQDVFPFIGNRPVAEIKPLELLEVLRLIEKRGALEKTRNVRRAASQDN